MTGCALRALASLLALVATVVAIGTGLNRWYGTSPTDVIGVALFSGFAVWIAGNLLLAAVNAWRERAALLTGVSGAVPVDGQRAILVGHLEAEATPLRAPLSGRECVAYTFEIYQMKRIGRTLSKVVLCDGIALAPSVVVTRSGSFGLRAVPVFDCAETELDRDAALLRAETLMRTIPLVPSTPRPSIEEQWKDNDGTYERLRRHVEEPVSLDTCKMAERILERGARVCVFGQYSAARRAIVPDPNDFSKITRVMKGDAESIARQLRASVLRRILGAVVCGSIAAGLIAAFVSSL